MVQIESEGKKFTINEISYGEELQIRDKSTVWDPVSGQSKMSAYNLNRELYLACVRDEQNNPVDIDNKEQISRKQARDIDVEIGKLMSMEQVKN